MTSHDEPSLTPGAPPLPWYSGPVMSVPAPRRRLTYQEYLGLERESEQRHEFWDGEIFAMAGGSPAHSALAARVIAQLVTRLRGQPCQVFTSDLRVRVKATGLTTYPDVTVVCGPLEHDDEDAYAIVNPVVLVEVSSEGTEAYDRNEKFAHYRRIPSLRAYVLVSQREPRLEVYRRNDDGSWTLDDARPPGAARLDAIGCTLDVAEIYAGVDLRR